MNYEGLKLYDNCIKDYIIDKIPEIESIPIEDIEDLFNVYLMIEGLNDALLIEDEIKLKL